MTLIYNNLLINNSNKSLNIEVYKIYSKLGETE